MLSFLTYRDRPSSYQSAVTGGDHSGFFLAADFNFVVTFLRESVLLEIF